MTDRGRAGEHRSVQILLALLIVGALVPIWVAPIPPLQDLPNHLVKVDILRRWMRGDQNVREIYALNLKPLANYTCYAVLLLLAPFFNLITAARILLSLIVAGLPLSAYAFLRRVSPGNVLLALFVPALNFNFFLMMGGLNFCLALAVHLLALTLFVSEGSRSGRRHLAFTVAATTLYFTHGFVFLILCGTVIALLVQDFRPERARRAAGLLPGIACLATMVVGTMHGGPEASGTLRPDFDPPTWDLVRSSLVCLINPHGRGPDTPIALAGFAALLACAVGTAVGFLVRWKQGVGLRSLLRQNPWLGIALALGVACLIAPAQLEDWYHLRARFSPLTVLTLLAAVHLPRRREARASLIAVFVVGALAIEARNVQEFHRRGAQVQEYVSGVSAVDAGASIVPVENLEEGPKYRDNLHSWGYYVIEKGGWGPNLHVQPSYNPLIYKVAPWHPDEGLPLGSEEGIRRMADCYDYLLLWNPRPEDETALQPSFELVRGTPHLRVFRSRAGVRRKIPATDPACAAAPASAHLWRGEV